MKLYHGTSSRNLAAIREKGIRPRGRRTGNWKGNPSNAQAVYLTNSYAGFYANCACNGGDKWVIFEVDTDRMNPFAFAPDEDFLEQATRNAPNGPAGDMYERTTYYREHLDDYMSPVDDECTPAALSLKHLGNCTYFGRVLPAAITRVAVVDIKHKSAKHFMFACFDPTITLLNYKVCGPAYRNSLKWLFSDGELEPDPLLNRKFPDTHDGITISNLEDAHVEHHRIRRRG